MNLGQVVIEDGLRQTMRVGPFLLFHCTICDGVPKLNLQMTVQDSSASSRKIILTTKRTSIEKH